MTRLTGLTALVTGGASGIGEATAVALSAAGAQVAVLDQHSAPSGTGLLSLTCDVTDSDAVSRAVDEVAENLGGLDIVINNAGIGAAGDVAANDDAEWHRVLTSTSWRSPGCHAAPYRTCAGPRPPRS